MIFSLNFKFWLSFSAQIRILLQEINNFYKFIYEYDKTLVIHVLIIIIYYYIYAFLKCMGIVFNMKFIVANFIHL